MKIMITGGAGFLGSHLTDAFLDAGHHVVVLDNFMTGRHENLDNAKEKHPNSLKVERIDITNPSMSRFYDDFDVVFNFACPASPKAYQRDPIHTLLTCVMGTKNVLDHAIARNSLFVQASTSEIYGDPEVHPQIESYKGCVNTFGPRACYDEGKRAAETLCYDYSRQLGARIKIGRIFNTFGPRMHADDGRVVSNFIVQCLQNKPITLFGDGQQTRSFCYVSDLIDGFVKLSQSQDSFQGPVNIGNPHEFTVLHLAETIKKLTNSKSKITFVDLPQDDPRQRRPDITLAKNELGWEPIVNVEEGLKRTISYFEERLQKGKK